MAEIDMSRLPSHVAIIMDGNGRWAKKFLLPRKAGHKAGAEALRKLSEKMNDQGYKMLTVYAFSTENWSRSDAEIEALMNLLRDYIKEYLDAADRNNMRINTIGDLSRLAPDLQTDILRLEEMTRDYPGMQVNIAINYGGRDELRRAVRMIAEDVKRGSLKPEDIDEQRITDCLDTAGIPDPDLIIRTAGEMRLSNFLLWQAAYSEFYATPKLWPDFTINDLSEAVAQFQTRDRRYGGRKS